MILRLAYFSKLSEEDTWHTVIDHRKKGHRNKENANIKAEEQRDAQGASAAAKKRNRHRKRPDQSKPAGQQHNTESKTGSKTKPAEKTVLEDPAMPPVPVPAAIPSVPAWTSEWKIPSKAGKLTGPQQTETKQEASKEQESNNLPKDQSLEQPDSVQPPVPVPPPFVPRLISLTEFVGQHSYEKRQKTSPRGLLNPHNMCFMNSVLQALIHSPNVLAFFDQLRRQSGIQRRPELPIVNALILLIQQYTFVPPHCLNLPPIYAEQCYSEICKNPVFEVERGRQEDAQEFLGHLLDVLESEFAPAASEAEPRVETVEDDGWHQVTAKPRRMSVREAGAPECTINPVRRLFGGRLSCELTRKKSRSVTFEPFQQLPLDISDDKITTVQAAVDNFLAPETLEPGCERHVAFDKVPPVLILCFKRFTYGGGSAGKIVRPLECGDLKIWCNGSYVEYKPSAIISHHGLAPDRGHYTCTTLAENDWFHCDDEYIESAADLSGKDAYMALYTMERN